jgi:NhaP-type Na+/H+ or K+/H+ antiporter
VGGLLLGLVFGIVSVFWIKKIFNDEILVLNITIISCYLSFFISEHVDLGIAVSAVIAVVSLSLLMAALGRTRISPEADLAVKEFWEYLVFASETIIFIIAGIIVSVRVLEGYNISF